MWQYLARVLLSFLFCLPVVCLECTEFVRRVEFCMSIACLFWFTYDAVVHSVNVFVVPSDWRHCGWHDVKCGDWLTSFMVFVCREGPHFTAGVRHLPHHEKVWPLEGHPEEPVRPLFQRNFHQSYVSILFLYLSLTPCLQSVCVLLAHCHRENHHVMWWVAWHGKQRTAAVNTQTREWLKPLVTQYGSTIMMAVYRSLNHKLL